MKKKRLNCETARRFSITQMLEKLRLLPLRESEKEAWYLSPFRSENRASFKVSKTKNRWYDHGLGMGGNVLDLVCRMHNCTIAQALDYLSSEEPSFFFQQQNFNEGEDVHLEIIKKAPITHAALIRYLHSRMISLETAKALCSEVHYSYRGKKYFAIGLPNARGGWELRNKYFKTSTSPKTISHLKNGQSKLIITEGMFDLMSLCEIQPQIHKSRDLLVLNSLAFTGRIEQIITQYQAVDLYMDNDQGGRLASENLMAKHRNCSAHNNAYKDYTDVNEWLMSESPIGIEHELKHEFQDVSL